MNLRFAAPLAAVASVAAFGIAYGLNADRWGVSPQVAEAAARLNTIPMTVDGWQGVSDEIDARQMHNAGAAGYLARRYTNAAGNAVAITILCGRHGPISLHPPTVCFKGSGMKQKGEPTTTTFDHGQVSSFTTVDFVPPDLLAQPMRTHWAWSFDARQWTNPELPRITFASKPYLYKMYIMTPVTETDSNGDFGPTDPEVTAFIQAFLKQLPDYIAAPAAKS